MISVSDRAIRNRLGDDALYNNIRKAISEMEKELLRLCGEAGMPRMSRDTSRMVIAGGKRLRPTLAYLCCHMGDSEGKKPEPISLMCMLELMHTASLIHDDVVDDAVKRRGIATINVTSGKAAAVQSGDFLLAKAMEKLPYYRGTGINEILASVSAEMCRGEFMQQRTQYDLEAQNEALYYLQISRKTSGLLSASCYTGALAGGLPKPVAEQLGCYGEKLGLAFQIRDDIMDYYPGATSGKLPGQDIRSGIFTLPVLLLKQELPEEMRCLLQKREKTKEDILTALEYLNKTDALERAEEQLGLFVGEAVAALASLEDAPEKDALVKLAEALR